MRSYYKILFLCGIILFTAFSCEEEEEEIPYACGIENPQENIDWLKFILDNSFCNNIYLYTYNDQEFIGVHDCPVGADYGFVIYNCDGTVYCQYIGFTGQIDCETDFLENFTKKLIYKQNE
jgi:hypothetical protein